MLLNHVTGQISGVAAIYNRHKYISEMREAVMRYETYLSNLVTRANSLGEKENGTGSTLERSAGS